MGKIHLPGQSEWLPCTFTSQSKVHAFEPELEKLLSDPAFKSDYDVAIQNLKLTDSKLQSVKKEYDKLIQPFY